MFFYFSFFCFFTFLFFVFYFFFCFLFVFFCFFYFLGFFFGGGGGFKGQVRWPEGPPHLALNPPYCCFLFFFVLSFLCFLIQKKPCFPLEKGIFCLFLSVALCLSLAFFGLPLFQFLFLCLSLVLVIFPSFLSFFFAFFWFLVFVSFFPFIFSLLLFHERNNIKILNCNSFLHQYFLFFWFPVLFFVSTPFFLSLLFPDSKLCFSSTSMFLVSKNQVEKKQQFLVKRGVATDVLFLLTCVLQNVKSYRFFLPLIFGQFWLMFKKHYKNRYFSTFLKAKNWKKKHFEVLLSGPSFFKKKGAETPIFIVFFWQTVFCKKNLAQIITPQKAKLGPDNSGGHIYIYMYLSIYLSIYLSMLWSYYLVQVWGF